MPKWLSILGQVVEKIPFERMLTKPRDNKKDLEDLAEILGQAKPEKVDIPREESPQAEPEPESPEDQEPVFRLEPRRQKVHLASNPSVTSTVTTKETVDYQNREIGKVLLTMQRHCVQKFRIAGRACDCGQSRHLLELEALTEEVMAMVDNVDIYQRILNWIERLGPISTVENVSSGKYDNLYPEFGNEARDLRKELLGTLDPKALFPHSEGPLPNPFAGPPAQETQPETVQEGEDLA